MGCSYGRLYANKQRGIRQPTKGMCNLKRRVWREPRRLAFFPLTTCSWAARLPNKVVWLIPFRGEMVVCG